jgi:hypothetical protein
MDGDDKGDACDTDVDGDGLDNPYDYCPGVYSLERGVDRNGDGFVNHQDQLDRDGDGVGTECDPDELQVTRAVARRLGLKRSRILAGGSARLQGKGTNLRLRALRQARAPEAVPDAGPPLTGEGRRRGSRRQYEASRAAPDASALTPAQNHPRG